MRYITIEHTVDAYPVELIIDRAKNNFKSLPSWIKKLHQENKLLIGGSKIQVETQNFIETLDFDDVLFHKSDGNLQALPKEQFYKLYKDVFSENSKGE